MIVLKINTLRLSKVSMVENIDELKYKKITFWEHFAIMFYFHYWIMLLLLQIWVMKIENVNIFCCFL